MKNLNVFSGENKKKETEKKIRLQFTSTRNTVTMTFKD